MDPSHVVKIRDCCVFHCHDEAGVRVMQVGPHHHDACVVEALAYLRRVASTARAVQDRLGTTEIPIIRSPITPKR